MSFTWKSPKDIFKGEGIYHLTFVVRNRVSLLGRLVPCVHHTPTDHIARTEATELGKIILTEFSRLQITNEYLQIIAKEIMPDHFHAVIWAHSGFDGSIKMMMRTFCQICSKHARRLAHPENYGEEPQSFECGNGANTLFEPPFIRTLSRKGQLDTMIQYVHTNPDNAWMRHLNPELYVIRRNVEHNGLLFDSMGKSRLLAWPDSQVIALSRSLTEEQIQAEVTKTLRRAEQGCVTYTAAINEGEKSVSRAIREAGYPLVVMLLDGFPPEESPNARYFHPSGVYHSCCGKGLLYLLDPLPVNYQNERVIELTESELIRKDEEKHRTYVPIPHTSKRWRMIAANVMLRMIAEQL